MSKKETNIQKMKVKKLDELRWLKYAKNTCVLMVILFLVYVGLLSISENQNLAELISTNLFVIIGFIICTANLYIWNDMNYMINDLSNYKNIDVICFKLIIIAVSELLLFNYAAVLLIVIGLVRLFNWKQLSIKDLWKNIYKMNQTHVVLICLGIMIVFILLSYIVVFQALIA